MLLECLTVLMAAIQLPGVTGKDLRARAYFDVNNVKVDDPMVLTIDFLGEADFKSLHPPALSKAVDRRDWKVDDASARTDTGTRVVGNRFEAREVAISRTLTYRVFPKREGVLWFPALEFEYEGADGVKRRVRANEIPVHAKVGTLVVGEEVADEANEMPQPPELMAAIGSGGSGRDVVPPLSDDEAFAWRKALAKPNADAFAAFDFPAAKMNEATCAIREGAWERAMKIYQKLEWRVGQTSEIERGIVAALAVRYKNPAVELPVWRQVLRPVLRYGWKGRVGIVVGGFALLALVFWLLGRGIRAIACLASALLLALPAFADTVETVVTNADGAVVHRKVVTGRNGGVSFSFSSSSMSGGPATGALPGRRRAFGGGMLDMLEGFDPFGFQRRVRYPKVTIGVWLESDKPSVVEGEDFNLILSLDRPRYVSRIDSPRISIDEQASLQQMAMGRPLPNIASRNPTNVVQRFALPMRAKAPFRGPLHFSVAGEYSFEGEDSFFGRSHEFSSGRRSASFAVKPLPEKGRPDGFSGIVAEDLRLIEECDLRKVETNDVVTIKYRLCTRGYVPAGFLPKGVAFEWGRENVRNGLEIGYQRYFVASGAATTPKLSVSYYDPRTRSYRKAEAGGTPLAYVSPRATPVQP